MKYVLLEIVKKKQTNTLEKLPQINLNVSTRYF